MEEAQRTMTGFTLIELTFTLAISGILMGIALPAYTTLLARNRLVATSNELHTLIAKTRSEAVRRRKDTVICPSIDQTTCLTSMPLT